MEESKLALAVRGRWNEVASSRNTGVSAHGTDTIRFITLLLVPYAQDTFLQPFRRPSPSTLNPSANSAPDLHRKPRHAWGGCAPARRRRVRPTSHSTHGRVRPTAGTVSTSQAYLRESPRGPAAPLHRVCAPSHLIHRGRRSTARRRAWRDTTCAHTHTRTRSRRTGERARLHVWRGQAGSTGGGRAFVPRCRRAATITRTIRTATRTGAGCPPPVLRPWRAGCVCRRTAWKRPRPPVPTQRPNAMVPGAREVSTGAASRRTGNQCRALTADARVCRPGPAGPGPKFLLFGHRHSVPWVGLARAAHIAGHIHDGGGGGGGGGDA